MTFGHLILRKIIKVVATRCQISHGELAAHHSPLAGFKGPISKGRGRLGWGMGGQRGRRGKGSEGGK